MQNLSPMAIVVLAFAALFVALLLWTVAVPFLPVQRVPLSYNWRNLVVRWKTTLLTAFGFMMVVALLVVMLAFVQGLKELSKKTGPEGNVIILRDGANDELFSDLLIDANVQGLWQQPEVDRVDPKDEASPKLASQEIYSIATQELPPKNVGDRPTYRFLQMRGLEDCEMAMRVHRLKLREGTPFAPNGKEVIMGSGIARTLGLKLNDTFYPRGGSDQEEGDGAAQGGTGPQNGGRAKDLLAWKVVGLLDSHGSPFDSEIWAKREDVGMYFGKDNVQTGQRFYTSIVVTTKDLPTAEKLAKELQSRVGQLKINAMTERKYYEEMAKSTDMFMVSATFIAIIMAVGGMFGLMNTMFAAVSQRIKDIGVLRILGFQRWQILHSFLLESLLLAVLGGALGLGLGWLVNGAEQTGYVSSGQGGGGKTVVFKMIVNTVVIQMAVGFTLFMGLIGGLLPSLTAMRLKVLDAVR
jgi:ABC-type antimicrobial peptide transport system permease subunit